MNNQEEDFEMMDFFEKSGNKTPGFQVPKDYFENIEQKVMSRIEEEKSKKSGGKLRSLSFTGWGSLLVAASLAGVFFWHYFQTDSSIEQPIQLTEEVIIDSEYLLDLDEYFVTENMEYSELEDLAIAQNPITDEEILAYSEYHEFSEYLLVENF